MGGVSRMAGEQDKGLTLLGVKYVGVSIKWVIIILSKTNVVSTNIEWSYLKRLFQIRQGSPLINPRREIQ